MSETTLPSGLIVATSNTAPAGAPRTVADDGGAAPFGPFRPLWTSGDDLDYYGHHGGEALISQITYDLVYRSNSAAMSVINKIVRQISRTPLYVNRNGADGSKTRVTIRSKDDPAGQSLASLLDRPTKRRGPVHLKQWMALPALIHGNSLLAKYRQTPDLPPTELLPMDWRFVTPYAEKGGQVELWRTDQLTSPRYIDVDETVHFMWEGTGAIGISLMEPLVSAVNLEEAAGRWLMAAFKNAARPSSLVTLPPDAKPTKPQMEIMRSSIEDMHKGLDQAFKVGLLAPGADWKAIGFNMQEAELMAVRQFSREEFCMVYDVKPGQVGGIATPGAGYASVVEINRDLARTTLPPWFTLIEQTIQTQLIDPEPVWEGLSVEFDLREFLKGEPEAVASANAVEIASGTLTVNEARADSGRPPSDEPDADKLFIQANNMKPLGDAANDQAPRAALPTP